MKVMITVQESDVIPFHVIAETDGTTSVLQRDHPIGELFQPRVLLYHLGGSFFDILLPKYPRKEQIGDHTAWDGETTEEEGQSDNNNVHQCQQKASKVNSRDTVSTNSGGKCPKHSNDGPNDPNQIQYPTGHIATSNGLHASCFCLMEERFEVELQQHIRNEEKQIEWDGHEDPEFQVMTFAFGIPI
jgi:hypothetical protein